MTNISLDKFDFLIGEWNLKYDIPQSIFCDAKTYGGQGSFKKILKDKYVIFEYSTEIGVDAKGIFAWDQNAAIYRYWWYEDTGNFLSATCNFIDSKTLAMNWHDSLLVQSFTQVAQNTVILEMKNPAEAGKYETILKVTLTKV